MLALKWCGKRAVPVISTIHEATELVTKRKDTGENVIKPEAIFSHAYIMRGVNLSDQYFVSYIFFKKKSMRSWGKLFIHLFNMISLDSYILHKKSCHNR